MMIIRKYLDVTSKGNSKVLKKIISKKNNKVLKKMSLVLSLCSGSSGKGVEKDY